MRTFALSSGLLESSTRTARTTAVRCHFRKTDTFEEVDPRSLRIEPWASAAQRRDPLVSNPRLTAAQISVC